MSGLKLFGNMVLGTGLVVYRYFSARREITKTRKLKTQLSHDELANLKAFPSRYDLLAHMPKGGVCVEIGVAAGAFSRTILDVMVPEKLYLIDYWKMNRRAHGLAPRLKGVSGRNEISDWQRIQTSLQSEICTGKVELLKGLSWDRIPDLPEGGVDWAYVDAAHDYEGVRRDLAALLPKMTPNGIICGHDYVKWGRFGFRSGVVEAVNEFALENEYELFALTFDSRTTPSFALRRK